MKAMSRSPGNVLGGRDMLSSLEKENMIFQFWTFHKSFTVARSHKAPFSLIFLDQVKLCIHHWFVLALSSAMEDKTRKFSPKDVRFC